MAAPWHPPDMEHWQDFEAPSTADNGPAARFRDSFPAPLPDGSRLRLPIRDYGAVAVTGFIANQASFAVVRRLALWMAEAARPFRPEVVCGLPTLGHVFAPLLAEALGHRNWVAAGYSRKRWYEDGFSVPVSSSTTPGERRIWLDPRVLHRMEGQRVLLVDDVVSTGTSALAGLALLRTASVVPVGFAVAMAQGDRWCASWPGVPVPEGGRPDHAPGPPVGPPPEPSLTPAPGTTAAGIAAPVPVIAAFRTPLLHPDGDGWWPDPATLPAVVLPPGGR